MPRVKALSMLDSNGAELLSLLSPRSLRKERSLYRRAFLSGQRVEDISPDDAIGNSVAKNARTACRISWRPVDNTIYIATNTRRHFSPASNIHSSPYRSNDRVKDTCRRCPVQLSMQLLSNTRQDGSKHTYDRCLCTSSRPFI